MGKYLYLQSKRLLRFLPGAVCVVLVLLGALMATFSLFTRQTAQSEENQKFQIALTGSIEDSFLQMGLAALEAFDSTRFSMEILQMEEKDAAAALEQGDIAAYIVVPEGFIDAALHGRIIPLKFVSTTGAAGMVSIVKEEITGVISTYLLESQRGIYGMADALESGGASDNLGELMNTLSIRYVEFLFIRDHTYSLRQLGIADDLGLEDYLLCGIAVVFLMLACLPFAPVMIRQDLSLNRMLAAKGRSAFGQAVCDFVVYALGLTAVLLISALILFAAADFLDMGITNGTGLLLRALPAVIMVAAFSFMLYALTGELIGGVLLQFFVTLVLCFVSGCMYPVYFFPETVQRLAAWLPAGLARTQLAGWITGQISTGTVGALILYSVIFFAVGVFVRARRIHRSRG